MTHAMRSTMSVPGLMAPVKGMATDCWSMAAPGTMPIDEVRPLPPDVVIAGSIAGSPR